MNSVFEQLKKDALYAQRSYSTELLYQAHGAAQMARQLGAISREEAMELNDMTVRFMNTDREYIRHKSEEFFQADPFGGRKGGRMRRKIMLGYDLENTARRLDGCFALLVALTDSAGVGSVVSDSALSAVTDLMKSVCMDFQASAAAAEDYPEGGPQDGSE